jgi:hypothetical protein
MATTSQNEAVGALVVKLYAPATRWSRVKKAQQWRAGGNQNHERRVHFLSSKATISSSDWTWMRAGRRHRSDETDHAPGL